MRRFIRIMGEAELEKYLKGEELVNKTVHKSSLDGSFGFCFFDAEDLDPLTAHHVLTGITPTDYMVEFLVRDEVAEEVLTKSKGLYHLPGAPLDSAHELPEYCTETYDRDVFVPYQIYHLMISYPAFMGEKEEK